VRPVEAGAGGSSDLAAYLDKMVRLLRGDGITFPNNQRVTFARLDPTYQDGRNDVLHAEGRWLPAGQTSVPVDQDNVPSTVAVTFGPQYGPVTASQIVEAARVAFRRGYTDLVAAGFSFDAAAFDEATNNANPRLKVHITTIRPDVNPAMDGLLKEQSGSQLFTVFGQPRTSVAGPDADGYFTVTMEGMDIYNPVENKVIPSDAGKVAAWFLDGDYDGRTFCITQAFFPDRGAWEKLQRALNGKDGVIDAERFEALSGTVSLPFPRGGNGCCAVKVIDPRGNEVMSVHRL
jgi:adenine-specific DNA-methyltransferase